MSSVKTYFQTSIQFGAYYCLAAFSFSLFINYTMGNPLGMLSFLGIWIPIVFICAAIKSHRTQLGGYISFGEAYRTGFFTIALGGILYAMLIYMFATLVGQSLVEDYKMQFVTQTEELRKLHYFDKKFIDTMLEGIEKTTIGSWVTGDYVNKVFGAVVVSLIAAAVYKKTKMPTDINN